MIGREVYLDPLPDVQFQGRIVKDGSSLAGPAASAFLVSNGYMRASRKRGIVIRHKDTVREHVDMILNVPKDLYKRLPHRCHS